MTADTTRTTAHPHLPPGWRDRFVLALRSRGAGGVAIGDGLAIADGHCADSGQTAQAVLGPPEPFAAAVALTAADRDARPTSSSVVAPLVGLASLFLAIAAARAWVDCGAARLTWGTVAAVAVILAGSVLLVRRPEVYLARVWLGGGVIGATLGAAVALHAAPTAPVLTMPPVVALAGAVVGLLGEALWSRRRASADPIRDPLRGDVAPRTTRLLRTLRPLSFSVAATVGVVLTLLAG